MAQLGETGGRDQAHIVGADHRDFGIHMPAFVLAGHTCMRGAGVPATITAHFPNGPPNEPKTIPKRAVMVVSRPRARRHRGRVMREVLAPSGREATGAAPH